MKPALICVLLVICLELFVVDAKIYQFKRYPFKKKKDDKIYRNKRVRCEETTKPCDHLNGLEYTKCVRRCMSENCYQELYGHDELEFGEIDVRLNSFKGCLSKSEKKYTLD